MNPPTVEYFAPRCSCTNPLPWGSQIALVEGWMAPATPADELGKAGLGSPLKLMA